MPYGVAIDIRFPLCFVILKPVKLCGVESHGMILSAVHGEGDNEKLQVIMADNSLPAGWKIC